MKIAIVGATGLVGEVMLRVLEDRKFPVNQLIPVASGKSVGKKVIFKGKEYEVVSVENAIKEQPHFALFSAGKDTSLHWAPEFAKAGTRVIDNSSAWRMHPDYKLIVPEVNGDILDEKDFIIANPNCSTIQMVVALNPLHIRYKIKRIVVSTYQSVTGTGRKAVTQLENERNGINGVMAYPYPIDKNCLPHIDIFEENGYTKEEMKMVNETKKIMRDDSIQVTATAVRVPVVGGHSESVNVTFEMDYDLKDIFEIFRNAHGVILYDDIANLKYPMPILSHNRDEVFVGRIRRDESAEKSLNLWIVADNLRKGAATNAVQIMERLVEFAGVRV